MMEDILKLIEGYGIVPVVKIAASCLKHSIPGDCRSFI